MAERVHITYDAHIGGVRGPRELPLVVGVLADLSGHRKRALRLREREFTKITRSGLPRFFKTVGPRLTFQVDDHLSDDPDTRLVVEIDFTEMADFEPEGLVRRVPALARFRRVRSHLAKHMRRRSISLDCMERTVDPEQKIRRRHEQGISLRAALGETIAELDRRLHAQVCEIIRAEPFRKLEGAWRSLHYLVSQVPAEDPLIEVRALDITRDTMLTDLSDAPAFDQSDLFGLVYSREYDALGGAPYAVLVADFEFTTHPDDVWIMEQLAGVAAAAHAIVVAGASPRLLNLESWSRLTPRRLPAEIESAEWSALRAHPDTRYLGLVAPHVLLRPQYQPDDDRRPSGGPVTVRLREASFGADGSPGVWGNGAFALAARVIAAFHRHRWCTSIRGLVEGYGVVDGLPEVSFAAERPGRSIFPPIEIAVSESMEAGLTELGLIPLCRVTGFHKPAFFGIPSVHRPPQMDDARATTNQRLSVHIPYMLAASRIAHYIKAMMRDRLGSPGSADSIRRELQRWLKEYTLLVDDPRPGEQARKPLREFKIDVSERPDRPGHYQAFVFLRPHFQLETPDVELSLAVDLPVPAKE